MFLVATQSSLVNLSPKRFEGTFHILDQKTVWYEDMSGSGAFIQALVGPFCTSNADISQGTETVSHACKRKRQTHHHVLRFRRPAKDC
jgi:hypothetical protein